MRRHPINNQTSFSFFINHRLLDSAFATFS
jgi:hypothetical protein